MYAGMCCFNASSHSSCSGVVGAVVVPFQLCRHQLDIAGIRIFPKHHQIWEPSTPNDMDTVFITEVESPPAVIFCCIGYPIIKELFPYAFGSMVLLLEQRHLRSRRIATSCGAWLLS